MILICQELGSIVSCYFLISQDIGKSYSGIF